MKNKSIICILLFMFVFVISLCYSVFLFNIELDEIWNYGFSYNISKGMVIYKDFNVMQTPLYFFIGSLFINIFGNYLVSLHILDALLIAGMVVILYKIIGWKWLLCYPFIIYFSLPSYNLLCLFFLFVILYLMHIKKDNDIIIGIIIGLVLISKQTVGGFLFIPYIIYSKNKFKSLISFCLPFMILILYVVYNGCLYNFIDYCILGLFDFASENSKFGIFSALEVINSIVLGVLLIKNKFKDKELFYIFMFQFVAFPLSDLYRFLISITPVVYYFVKKINNNYFYLFIGVFAYVSFFLLNAVSIKYLDIINDKNFMRYRRSNGYLYNGLENEVNIIDSYKGQYDYKFFIGHKAYLVKLYMEEEIGQYDFILNGNMGYKGDDRIMEDIDKMCKSNKCLFFVDQYEFNNLDTQTNRDIYYYVISNYITLVGSSDIAVYGNFPATRKSKS